MPLKKQLKRSGFLAMVDLKGLASTIDYYRSHGEKKLPQGFVPSNFSDEQLQALSFGDLKDLLGIVEAVNTSVRLHVSLPEEYSSGDHRDELRDLPGLSEQAKAHLGFSEAAAPAS